MIYINIYTLNISRYLRKIIKKIFDSLHFRAKSFEG
jgi:hypothetical protein